MGITKESLVSQALVLLGADSISSFAEESNESDVASQFYETTIASLLCVHNWTFATRQAKLSQNTVAPILAYKYSYHLPTDLLQMRYLFSEYNSLPVLDWKRVGKFIQTDLSPAFSEYTYRVLEADLPAFFIPLAKYSLALAMNMVITRDKANQQLLNSEFEILLSRSQITDNSQKGANKLMYQGNLLGVR